MKDFYTAFLYHLSLCNITSFLDRGFRCVAWRFQLRAFFDEILLCKSFNLNQQFFQTITNSHRLTKYKFENIVIIQLASRVWKIISLYSCVYKVFIKQLFRYLCALQIMFLRRIQLAPIIVCARKHYLNLQIRDKPYLIQDKCRFWS